MKIEEPEPDSDDFWELYQDVFNPAESDLEYFLRRKKFFEDKEKANLSSRNP